MGAKNTAFAIDGYSYADGKATFNGIELPGVTAFEYKRDQAKSNNYGFGKNPVSRSRGKVEYAGSMDMDWDTQGVLNNLSPTKLLADITPGIMIFSLERFDGTRETITMTGFEFNGDGLSGSEGDENLTGTIEVIFGSFIKKRF